MRATNRLLLIALAAAGGATAGSTSALAQGKRDVACKPTETQAECHARLKCKPNEELEECQKRLRRGGGGGDQGSDENGGGGDQGDRGDSDRGDRDRGDGGGGSDRGDRWHREGGGDGGGGDRGDRWNHDDDGGGGGRGDRWRRGRGGGGRDGGGGYSGTKTFGLGLEVGEPTGFNGKYFLSDTGALDFGLGWIYRHYYYDDGLHIYADYLWHPTSLASTPSFELPFYVGLGVRFWDFEYCDRDFCYDGSAIGIRVPIGISFDFNNAPLDIFLQVVPVLDFLRDDYYDRYRDRTHLGVDLSAGIRFWF